MNNDLEHFPEEKECIDLHNQIYPYHQLDKTHLTPSSPNGKNTKDASSNYPSILKSILKELIQSN